MRRGDTDEHGLQLGGGGQVDGVGCLTGPVNQNALPGAGPDHRNVLVPEEKGRLDVGRGVGRHLVGAPLHKDLAPLSRQLKGLVDPVDGSDPVFAALHGKSHLTMADACARIDQHGRQS